MASLDIDPLLRTIDLDAPCGGNLEYDAAYIALKEEAKGTPEKQIGDHIEPAVPPNWRLVRKQALELLERTRDLYLLVELARANLNMEGLRGLKDSLSLLRRALEEYWDSIHPQLDPDDDNDPTLRINILTTICDVEAFLRPLSNAPLVESRAIGRFSLRDFQYATGRLQPPAEATAPQLAVIQGAFSEVPVEDVLATRDALQGSLDDIDAIENFLTRQVGIGNAPSFAPIRDLLEEALGHVKGQLERLGVNALDGEGAVEAASATEEVPAKDGGRRLSVGQIDAVGNRQEVMRLFDLICEYYAKHEPSSPVPLLVRRAKRLVTMDFMEIMQDLVPSGIAEASVFKGPDAEEGS